MPQTTATELPSSILRLVQKADCVTSAIAVSSPLLGQVHVCGRKAGVTAV